MFGARSSENDAPFLLIHQKRKKEKKSNWIYDINKIEKEKPE